MEEVREGVQKKKETKKKPFIVNVQKTFKKISKLASLITGPLSTSMSPGWWDPWKDYQTNHADLFSHPE